MVQVDIFWSYGMGAGIALAGAKQIINEKKAWWTTEPFILNLLWLALVFVPSGLYLLWSNPGWETMFVARNHESIPAWLVTLFGLTNVTQGILGYYVTAYFLQKRKPTVAKFQAIWSHAAMVFILVFGWDGSGYRRFFYAGTGEEWHSGVHYDISQFFSSQIFFTLLGLGVFFIPTFTWVCWFLMKPTSSTNAGKPVSSLSTVDTVH